MRAKLLLHVSLGSSLASAASGSLMRDICSQGLNTVTKVRWPQGQEWVKPWVDGGMAEEER